MNDFEIGLSFSPLVSGGVYSPTDMFHRVNNVLPDDQVLVTVDSDTSVGQALELLKECGFSQIPVVEGDEVLGMFSFRSFALRVIDIRDLRAEVKDLPVEEFIEAVSYVHVQGELPATFDLLDRDNAVLVGTPRKVQGILTPMDVLTYLYKVASPFIVLSEIELTMRMLIRACVTVEAMNVCIKNSLQQQYKDAALPSGVDDMTFNDYVQVVGDGRNWPRFELVFGSRGELARKMTRTKLEEIRDLRNVVFHFKREITVVDRVALWNHREWLLRKARKFEARLRGSTNE